MTKRKFYIGFADTVGVMAESYAEAKLLAKQAVNVDGVALEFDWEGHEVTVKDHTARKAEKETK